jgi:hypothetical protein
LKRGKAADKELSHYARYSLVGHHAFGGRSDAGGVGGARMKNDYGVIIGLESRTKGLRFSLSTSGVTVTMSK